MVQIKLSLVLLINFLSILKVSLLETVHFTNSPNKILRANNFTTYKVEVPNGDPITIIEANVDLIKKNIRFNNVENTKYSINHNQHNGDNAMDLKTSLSMTVTPHSNNDEYENSLLGDEESGNLSPEQIHQQHSMKTVYSPELLQKFLKDYANKVQSTEATISAASVTQSTEYHNNAETSDKYESIEAEDDDGNRRVSSVDENKEPATPADIQERKHYRPGGNNNNNYPYNKNNGWVTLEAVPWSKSKVSKWQSSVKPSYSNQNSYNYQNNNNGYNRPSRPHNYDDDYNSNNNDNDDYYNAKPSRPSYQNNQFFGGSSQNRPQPPPDYSHSSHHSSSSFNGNNNYNNYDNRPNRPYQPEIITDNRPSNFPNHPDHSQQHQPHHHESSHHHNEYNHNRPSSYDVRPNRPPNDYHYSSGPSYNHYSNKDGPHPLNYPNGDGEWVLVSTTKGYQFPKRNGERAMLFQAQNGVDGTDTRKNDNKGIITAASQQYDTSVSIRPPYQSGPTKTTQQQVKLTVLPHFVKNENGPQKNPHYNNNHQYNTMDVSVYRPSNYNGIIESEPSSQTVEESVAAAANANEGNSVAQSVKKKRKAMKNYAVMRKNTASDSTAMLAAVGAGLLPAGLGLLAPMVFGK